MSDGFWPTRWLLLVALCASSRAAAQAEPADAPGRYLALWSMGEHLRLTQDEDYGQDLAAPLFTELFVGHVFASSAQRFRHGVGIGASVNLTGDGGYAEPIYAGDQVAIMPAYLLYPDLGADLFGKAHLGVPIVVTGGATAGLELAATFGYRLLARFGLFAEVFADAFAGAGSSIHPTAGLELGLFFDYEALP